MSNHSSALPTDVATMSFAMFFCCDCATTCTEAGAENAIFRISCCWPMPRLESDFHPSGSSLFSPPPCGEGSGVGVSRARCLRATPLPDPPPQGERGRTADAATVQLDLFELT